MGSDTGNHCWGRGWCAEWAGLTINAVTISNLTYPWSHFRKIPDDGMRYTDTDCAHSTSNFLTSHTVESLCPQLLDQLRGAALSLLVITLSVACQYLRLITSQLLALQPGSCGRCTVSAHEHLLDQPTEGAEFIQLGDCRLPEFQLQTRPSAKPVTRLVNSQPVIQV